MALCNTDDCEQVAEFVGHDGSIVALASSTDGQTMFSGSLDGSVCRWELLTGTLVNRYNNVHEKVSRGSIEGQ